MTIDDLSPNDLVILATLIGILIASSLDDDEQNVAGNFIESIGQTILTISAQGEALESQMQEDTYQELNSRIQSLEQQIKAMEERLRGISQ